LGDSADSPRFIETVPKRGYRFIAPVTRSVSPSGSTPHTEPAAKRARRAFPLWVRALLAVALLGSVFVLIWRMDRTEPPAAIRSLVVLPLQNLSPDAGQEYFADGITDELTTDLARIRPLRVLSRTTAMHYKETTETLPQIARHLGVDAVLEGSVSRSQSRIRVRVQLVRGATDEHIWANSYERDLGDAVVLESEIARDIADQIQVHLSPQERTELSSRASVDPEAYEAYLKGKYFFDQRLAESNRKSIAEFRKAISLDPGFAAAQAGLADALVSRSYLGVALPSEVMPEAKRLIANATAIDPNLPDVHVSSGWIKLTYDWDWSGAEQEIKRALQLNPNSARAHQLYGNYYLALGRTDEAISEMERARELDPLGLFINRDLGRALYYARRYDAALDQLRQTLELDPTMGGVNEWISWSYEKTGARDKAFQAYLNVETTDGVDRAQLNVQEQFYKRAGWNAFWRRELDRTRSWPPGGGRYLRALILARLGENDTVLKLLHEQVEMRTVWVTWMNVDPELDGLRSDARFQQLVRATGR
jgi:TolB-like protein/Tfp pilus assembly protein PilF